MTGVLGLKAYRCLDNSPLVLFVLVAFFCASSAFLGLQLGSIHGVRRLSGRLPLNILLPLPSTWFQAAVPALLRTRGSSGFMF